VKKIFSRENLFRASGVVVALALLVGLGMFALSPRVTIKRVYAQNATTVPGFYTFSANAVTNAAIGSALAVTNPASNFVMLVQGGPVYYNGTEQLVGQSTITLAASNTYLIVWNNASEQLYAKTAVVAGGSLGTSAINGPGNPYTLLAAIPGSEIPIALVTCNATACGNGGNGTITDERPVANFPGAGTPFNTSTFANLPTTNVTDGTAIICSGCTQPTTGSVTCTTGAVPVLAVRVNSTWRCY
jgi:hypothetical protein